jgi:cell division transport system permease protein
MKIGEDSYYKFSNMWISLKRIFKMGWQSFCRDGGTVIANIFILVLTISLISSLFLSREVSQFLISKIEEKVDVSAYFKEEIQEDEIFRVREELSRMPEVKSVKYVSREEALEDFTKRHEDDPVLMKSLEEIGQNPFLASLNIRATESSQYESIVTFLGGADFEDLIEKVDYYQRKPVIERIFSITGSIEKFGLFLSIFLVLVSFLIVLNTIRLAIYNFREEIEIQRLVGASNWFIRGPFLVQGIIAGGLSALIALFIFILSCWALSPKIEFLFSDLNIWTYFTQNFFIILLIQLVTGIGLGIISSTIAIRKYLKI